MMRTSVGTCLLLAHFAAQALTAGQLYEKVAPSVWAVRAIGGGASLQGSAVVVGPGLAVASCQVVARASVIQIFRQGEAHNVKLERADHERDLCTLAAGDIKGPVLEIGKLADLKVGQRVYAVGNPEGLYLTFSEGQVSGLRAADPRQIQTTAGSAPGSSGGGLFDAEGRLIGIMAGRSAQNQNLAVAAEWIGQIGTASIPAAPGAAATARPASFTPPGVPLPGAIYQYRWTDRQHRREQDYTVRISNVSGWNVSESFSHRGQKDIALNVDARAPVFIGRVLDGGQSLLEFAPYFPTDKPPDPQAALPSLAYPGGQSTVTGPWALELSCGGWEQVSVPAGSYRAMRVHIRGTRPRFGMIAVSALRFEYTAWYAPEVRRYVKFQHESWSSVGQVGNVRGELLVYRPD